MKTDLSRPSRFVGITLTGVDELIAPDAMQHLLDMGSVELAFLYAADTAGKRFVSLRWLQGVLPALHGRLALHVCGETARQQLANGHLRAQMACLQRVQVNGTVSAAELPMLAAQVPVLITQHNTNNVGLATVVCPGHALLVDDSGGLGRLPGDWARPDTSKPVGFAGGLSVENLAAELPRLSAVARGQWWLDMESSLRDACDRFDLARASVAAQLVLGAV